VKVSKMSFYLVKVVTTAKAFDILFNKAVCP